MEAPTDSFLSLPFHMIVLGLGSARQHGGNQRIDFAAREPGKEVPGNQKVWEDPGEKGGGKRNPLSLGRKFRLTLNIHMHEMDWNQHNKSFEN